MTRVRGHPIGSLQRLKRWGIEAAGWALVVLGVVALALPGPGLLSIVAGLGLLATQHVWAKRLLRPVTARALKLAIKGVQTWPRIVFSVVGGLMLVAMGIVWGLGPPAPRWWPIDRRWWLLGGWTTGVTLIISGAAALVLIVYSFRRFRDPSEEDVRTADDVQDTQTSHDPT
ncbi:MAG: PGPGW domain-containing protein [Propionibacteriaceae bacterium]|nr:PGPGW domain-containing protein [Propionibacteriaceae bacterium]